MSSTLCGCSKGQVWKELQPETAQHPAAVISTLLSPRDRLAALFCSVIKRERLLSVLTQGMDGPGMDGPAWKRQRMDDGLGGPSRQDSVFYKTRMCHKYESPTALCFSEPIMCCMIVGVRETPHRRV